MDRSAGIEGASKHEMPNRFVPPWSLTCGVPLCLGGRVVFSICRNWSQRLAAVRVRLSDSACYNRLQSNRGVMRREIVNFANISSPVWDRPL
jgi:hypothetical protein